MKPPACFEDPETCKEITRLCRENNIDTTLLKDLCAVIQQHSGSGRKSGVDLEITDFIDQFLARSPD